MKGTRASPASLQIRRAHLKSPANGHTHTNPSKWRSRAIESSRFLFVYAKWSHNPDAPRHSRIACSS